MEIDISLCSTRTAIGAKTVAGSTSVVDVSLLVVGIIGSGTSGTTEISISNVGGSTTVAVAAAILGVATEVKVKTWLRDDAVSGVRTTKSIAEVRASFGATLVMADVTVKSRGAELRSGSETTEAKGTAILGVTTMVKVKSWLSDSSTTSEGTTVAIASTRVAKLDTVEGLLFLLTLNGSLLDSTAEIDLFLRSNGLGDKARRSLVSVERFFDTLRMRSASEFSSGGSSNNSSESESLEHFEKLYKISVKQSLIRININDILIFLN